jgi:hypothetical protein
MVNKFQRLLILPKCCNQPVKLSADLMTKSNQLLLGIQNFNTLKLINKQRYLRQSIIPNRKRSRHTISILPNLLLHLLI